MAANWCEGKGSCDGTPYIEIVYLTALLYACAEYFHHIQSGFANFRGLSNALHSLTQWTQYIIKRRNQKWVPPSLVSPPLEEK